MGYDGVYEGPENLEVLVRTDIMNVEEVEAVLNKAKELEYL